VHDAVHHRKWKWSWFRRIQHHHLVHHRFNDRNFGMWTRFWDQLFGTSDQRP